MIETFTSADDLADAAASAVGQQLAEGLSDRGRASLVATGGRSPGPVYDRLSRLKLDWVFVAVTLSAERHVDVQSTNSNSRLMRERL